ncbi:MAG: hypothetical protein KME09_00220 [Pleurocapsa minor HA4230-MV1]|jgi:hypothetical protein|nr:hypothetical protein [Pleurocapsa minor HA4230-MV1]
MMPEEECNSTSSTDYIQINYKGDTDEGKIINYFRRNHAKRSQFVRNWIVNCFAYPYSVEQGAEPIQRIQACMESKANLEKQLEQVKADLYREINRKEDN